MSIADETPAWAGRTNPFPRAAVAGLYGGEFDLATIETPAVRQIRAEVDRYLAATRSAEDPGRDGAVPRGSGTAIVIAGEYGTGKTHLAMEILAHLERHVRRTSQDVRRIYHAAGNGTFLDFYTELMEKELVQRRDFVDRVHEFYAEIVVESLRSLELPDSFISRLSARDIDPVSAVGRLGLDESSLLESLRERLRAVTENRDFGSALALLIQPELEGAVWNWLCGRRPDQTLIERGISERLDSDGKALEALGVIALLHGRQGHRFVLVIDEIQNMMLGPGRSARDVELAFKKLLEVFRNAGAFLAVCGLPDMFAILPKDTGRYEPVVIPSTLTGDDVRWYIEEMQDREFHERILAPFDEESASYLTTLADGVPRQVIRFCYRAYEQAAATGLEVTGQMLREIAHTELATESAAAVRAEIERLLKEDGRSAEPDRTLGNPPQEVRADLWVPTGPDGAGCAIVIADVLLDADEVPGLLDRAAAIRASGAQREAMLVVTGYLGRDLRARLTRAYSVPPLTYNRQTFSDELLNAINLLGRPATTHQEQGANLGSVTGDALDTLMEQVERVSRQHTQSQRLIRDLSKQLDAAQLGSAEQLAALRRELAAATAFRTDSGAGSAQRRGAQNLPTRLQSHFDLAQQKLAAFGDIAAICRRVLIQPAGAESGRLALSYRLRAQGAYASIGVAQLLNALLIAFQEGVGAWLDAVSDSPGNPTEAQRASLRTVCNTYEALYDTVPLIQLDVLADLAVTIPDRDAPPVTASKAARRAALQNTLSRLGDTVFQDAIELTVG